MLESGEGDPETLKFSRGKTEHVFWNIRNSIIAKKNTLRKIEQSSFTHMVKPSVRMGTDFIDEGLLQSSEFWVCQNRKTYRTSQCRRNEIEIPEHPCTCSMFCPFKSGSSGEPMSTADVRSTTHTNGHGSPAHGSMIISSIYTDHTFPNPHFNSLGE